jgi:hypothetical protein
MNRLDMWKMLGLGAAFVVVIASPVALHAVSAAPEPRPNATPAPWAPSAQSSSQASADAFGPVCKANQVADSRPDPAWVVASFGNDHCVAPAMPAVIDGYSASREQIVAGMAAAKIYAAKADAYQQCISNYVALRKAAAGKDKKPIEAALITIEDHRILASQADKKKAVNQIEVAINAFNEYGSECPD